MIINPVFSTLAFWYSDKRKVLCNQSPGTWLLFIQTLYVAANPSAQTQVTRSLPWHLILHSALEVGGGGGATP